jgi:hypothetical protein
MVNILYLKIYYVSILQDYVYIVVFLIKSIKRLYLDPFIVDVHYHIPKNMFAVVLCF